MQKEGHLLRVVRVRFGPQKHQLSIVVVGGLIIIQSYRWNIVSVFVQTGRWRKTRLLVMQWQAKSCCQPN